ncbi:unnamed protein product [Brassicogethes aeneus]|uniref:Nidogen n=1 Tax=Brassicogethes aeneus TaxID=1431903 RepID=A0A9P0FLD8_BRAAE|nr:unnamed protein product [Brassicogethes aeneus]
MKFFLLFVLALGGFPPNLGIPANLLYDWDVEEIQELPHASDVASKEIPLRVPIVFFGVPFDTIWVNSNGIISFQTDIQQFLNIQFPLDYPIIAPFYSHVDLTKSGTVTYYETDSPGLLERATNNVHDAFTNSHDFQATSLFLVTWHAVGYYKGGEDKLNTFQVAIISDGQQSYVEFLYPENGIQWIKGTGDESGLPDARAQAGLITPEGRVYTLPGSGTEQVKNLESRSNIGLVGQFMYRVDQVELEEPDLNGEDQNMTEAPLTCSEATSVCHPQASCVDYEEGFCCQCKEKYYGNGKSCIKKDAPLRINGKVSGKINEETLDNLDLQSYIVMVDGRAYTAISKIPEAIGFDVQSLQILGGVIGYIFAKPVREALNGYQLTGGVFNHSATVTFLNTSQVVTIKQRYVGLDVFDQLRLEADIQGEIPNLPQNVKVDIEEYQEEYTMTRPGLIQMSSQRSFKYVNALNNQDVVYVYNVEQAFTFDSCLHDNTTVGAIWKLRVGKNFISYEAREQIIRFGMSNKVIPFGDNDPCEEGRSKCGPNSSCVVDNDNYRCVCNPGYQQFFRDNMTLCADINECATGQHDCDYNALCTNVIGTFTCQCLPGFEGNGHVCENARSCANVQCAVDAECVEQNEIAQCMCQRGFTGDGYHCRAVVDQSCHVNNNCSPYGICSINPRTNQYNCECLPNYEGNGYECRPKYTTTTPTTTTEEITTTEYPTEPSRIINRCLMGVCWCPQGYKTQPNSKYCIPANQEPEPVTEMEESCDVARNCHKDAQCIYSQSQASYVCQCNDGLEGDGYTCNPGQVSCSVLDNCDPHATCLYDDNLGKSRCICSEGYIGDGYVCSSATGCSSCTATENCAASPETGLSECVCKENHHRDSQHQCVPSQMFCGAGKCVEDAECMWNEELQTQFCACKPGFMGDGITECRQKPVGCDVANNCAVDATCQYDEQLMSYTCRCKEGYQGDGLVCYKERTCQVDPGMCSPYASCIIDRSFYCKCNPGYVGNGTSCKPIPVHEGNFLLLNYGIATLKIYTDEPTSKKSGRPIQVKPNQVSVGLDIDCIDGRVYWSDITNRAIRSSTFNGSEKQDFIRDALGSPEGLAIDWVSRNIYWTDSTNDTIEVANLDSKRRRTLFKTGLVNPRGIAVHPQRGKIFWTDWNRKSPKIEWANADGTGRDVFLRGFDVSLPNSLTIDYDTDSLCYADAGTKKIECVQIDTRAKQTYATNCTYPFGITVTDRNIYWSDWITKKIESVDKHSLRRAAPIKVPIFASGAKLYGLVAVPNRCPEVTNVCQYYRDQCPDEHICVPNGSGSRSCLCGYKSDKLDEQPSCEL